MGLKMDLKRKLRKPYYSLLGFSYRFTYFLDFLQRRYIYRLVTGTSVSFPRDLSEEQLITYLEARLVNDFKSGRISEHGFNLFLEHARKVGSVKLHCAISRVLFESRAVSAKFKRFDRMNDEALLGLLGGSGGSYLSDLSILLGGDNNVSWSSSFVYRLIGILFDRKEWGLLKYFSEFYIRVSSNNLFVNKCYVISRLRLKEFSVVGDVFSSDYFKSIAFVDQIELIELWGEAGRVDCGDFDYQSDDYARFYLALFQRLIVSGGVNGKVGDAVVSLSESDAFRFVEVFYKEKYLFGAKALVKIEKLSSDFLESYPPLLEVYEKIRDFDGAYGGVNWAKFIEDIYISIDRLELANGFDEHFLALTGYSQHECFLSVGSGSVFKPNDSVQESAILVCNSRISKFFFTELHSKYGFSHVVGYSTVAQTEVDPSVCSVVSISGLVPQPGSPLDMEAYQISHELSLRYFSKVLHGRNVSAWSRKFIREVFSLAIEDRLFGHIKRVVLLVEHIRMSGVRRVVFSYKLQEYKLMHALAQAVHRSLGIDCVLLREFGRFDLSRHYGFSLGVPPLKVSFFESLRKYESFKFHSGESDKDSLFLLSSFGDAAYYKSALQILSASDYDKNYIFNLGDRFVDRSFLSGNIQLIEPSGASSFDSLNVSFCEFDDIAPAAFEDGISYLPYAEFVHYIFEAYIFKWIAKLNNQIELVVRFFEFNYVSSLVTIPGRAPLSRAVTMIAGASGLKTVDVQAFFISPMPRYKGSLADSYCAITRDQLDLYVNCHQREIGQRLYRVGSLMMDNQLSTVLGDTLESARSEYRIGLDKFVVFFAEQHGDGGYSFDIAKNLISSLPSSMHLIIKLHPRSPVSAVDNLANLVRQHDKASQVLVTQSGHLYKLIVASDVVVTQFSNVGLEAAVLKKKVLSVLISGDAPVLDFGALGIADVVYTLEDMNAYINRLAEVKVSGVAPYLLANPELGDGQSGRRVIDVSRGIGFYHEGVGAA